MVEYSGSVICSTVPHPDDGRCWNRPCESWSLRSPRCPRFSSFDSCRLVAIATTAARSSMPAFFVASMMAFTLPVCSSPRSIRDCLPWVPCGISVSMSGFATCTAAAAAGVGVVSVNVARGPVMTPVDRARPAIPRTLRRRIVFMMCAPFGGRRPRPKRGVRGGCEHRRALNRTRRRSSRRPRPSGGSYGAGSMCNDRRAAIIPGLTHGRHPPRAGRLLGRTQGVTPRRRPGFRHRRAPDHTQPGHQPDTSDIHLKAYISRDVGIKRLRALSAINRG